ncbi:MAG: DUF2142 domain-containing protein, partial [Streptococcaceae bacterium]|nr:DUF2142 domain-containing protein [Streptococcaceae bacterium]
MQIRRNKKEKLLRIFASEENLNKNIHKIYLMLAISLGTILAIGMPFFNEPDGVYHFVNSANIANLTVDVSAYGETDQWFGDQFAAQRPNRQDGTFFQKYFKNEVQLMNQKNLPRLQTTPGKTSFRYWSAIIPAIGVWVGYHIYPSMGVMIVVARLVNMFLLSLGMFFIIKYVQKGKLFFILSVLNPVTLNLFASLSNDGLSVVLVSWMSALAINMIVENKLQKSKLIWMIIVSAVIAFAAKTNFLLLLLVIPLLLLVFLSNGRLEKRWQDLTLVLKIVLLGVTFALVAVASYIVLGRFGGAGHIIYRWLINIFYQFTNSTFSIFTSSLTVPLGNFNTPMPIWLSAAWALILALVALSEEKFVKHSLISWGSLAIFMMNLLGLYLIFMNDFTSGRNGELGSIGGIQGRYITPLFLMVFIFISDSRFRLKV